MSRTDLHTILQIRDGPCDAQDPVIRSHAVLQFVISGFQKTLSLLCKDTVLFNGFVVHLPVAGNPASFEPFPLKLSPCFYSSADLGGSDLTGSAAHLRKADGRNVRAQIDAVQKRLRKFTQIMGYLSGSTPASVHVRIVAAGTWIHGGYEHETGRENIRAGSPGKTDDLVFHRLSEGFQGSPGEFRARKRIPL